MGAGLPGPQSVHRWTPGHLETDGSHTEDGMQAIKENADSEESLLAGRHSFKGAASTQLMLSRMSAGVELTNFATSFLSSSDVRVQTPDTTLARQEDEDQLAESPIRRSSRVDINGGGRFADEDNSAGGDLPQAQGPLSPQTQYVSYDEFASQSLKSKLMELFTAAHQADGTTSFETATPDMYLDQTELKFRLRTHELALLLKNADLMKKINSNNDGGPSATELLKALDVNNDGKISLEEFFAGLTNAQQQYAQPRDGDALEAPKDPLLEHDLNGTNPERNARVGGNLGEVSKSLADETITPGAQQQQQQPQQPLSPFQLANQQQYSGDPYANLSPSNSSAALNDVAASGTGFSNADLVGALEADTPPPTPPPRTRQPQPPQPTAVATATGTGFDDNNDDVPLPPPPPPPPTSEETTQPPIQEVPDRILPSATKPTRVYTAAGWIDTDASLLPETSDESEDDEVPQFMHLQAKLKKEREGTIFNVRSEETTQPPIQEAPSPPPPPSTDTTATVAATESARAYTAAGWIDNDASLSPEYSEEIEDDEVPQFVRLQAKLKKEREQNLNIEVPCCPNLMLSVLLAPVHAWCDITPTHMNMCHTDAAAKLPFC